MTQASARLSRSTATRSRLRRAAIEVFATKGFHETKVSDIVTAAGVTQPTFYIYHNSKEAAYEALVEEFREALHRATRDCLISPGIVPGDLFADVQESFKRFLTVLHDDPALTRIGFFQPPAGEVTQARMVEWTMENMEHEQKAGILRSDVPVKYQARMVVGLLAQMADTQDSDALEIRAGVCARLFCSALSA